jgi:hypothetical protein
MLTTRFSSAGAKATALRLGARTALASGVLAAIGMVFLVGMFVSFAIGATSPGMVFGRINDVLVMVSYALAMPTAIALHGLLRPQAPLMSGLATVIGIVALAAIVVLQLLLVVGVLTFEEQIGPVSIALLVAGAWFVVTGYLGSSKGALPGGVRHGLLAATYVGYPIWAFWLGGRLRRSGGDPERPHRVSIMEGSRDVNGAPGPEDPPGREDVGHDVMPGPSRRRPARPPAAPAAPAAPSPASTRRSRARTRAASRA